MINRSIITVDGPAGAGKSTISRQLAERLGFIYLDTGALYRAVALRLIRLGFSGDERDLACHCTDMRIALKNTAGQLRVFMDDEDVTEKLRTEEIGIMASRISALPAVRERLLSVQRDTAKNGGVVAEGRDMGTVVFPEAEIKFFLDASAGERAARRYRELRERGENISLQDVESDMLLRDRQDRERSVAPLRPSYDAVIVDSTDKAISQVVDIMMGIINTVWRDREPCKKRR
ncbi:MAG: (d)CMP kinase [Syntrophales bacterium]